MAKTIQLLVKTSSEETTQLHSIVVGEGKPTRVKAVKNARYQLKDPSANDMGPQYIQSKRVGKNLHVSMLKSNDADLIIEGYYNDGFTSQDNTGLYGMAENGQMYEYIPEDPSSEGLAVNLQDGAAAVSQVLGGLALEGGFSLSTLPIATVAAVAAVAGSGIEIVWNVAGGAVVLAANSASKGETVEIPKGQTGALAREIDSAVVADHLTNNHAPKISGKAQPNATVEIILNGVPYSTKADANGNYSVSISNPLPDGKYTPVIKVSNSAGSTEVNGVEFEVDTQILGTGALTSNETNDTGISLDDGITSNNKPNFSGTGKPGDLVKVTIGNKTIETVIDSDGNWTTPADAYTQGMPSGKYDVSIAISDLAGNSKLIVTTVIIDIDGRQTQPEGTSDVNASAEVHITAMSTDTGVKSNDFITKDSTLVYSGTVTGYTDNGAKVKVELISITTGSSGTTETVLATAYLTPTNGLWAWARENVTQADGLYKLRATLVDPAGNRINPDAGGQASQDIEIDSSITKNQPSNSNDLNTRSQIAIGGIDDGLSKTDKTTGSKDTGTSATDLITKDNTLTFSGTTTSFNGTQGAKVHVQVVLSNGTVFVDEYVNPDATTGAWTFNNQGVTLADGNYTIKADIVDKAGNIVVSSAEKVLVIDSGTGTNPANSPSTDPNAGSDLAVSVTSIDDGIMGNSNTAGSNDTGTLTTDFVTNDNTLVVKGTVTNFTATGGADGDRVHVQLLSADGTTLLSNAYLLPDSDGTWSWDRTGITQEDGKYQIKADIVDLAGNIVKAGNTQLMVIDTSITKNPGNGTADDSNTGAGLTLAITSIHDADNGSIDSGSSSSDFTTNDQRLIIKGSAAGFSNTDTQAGDALRVQIVKADGTVVRDAFVDVNTTTGDWSLDNASAANELAEGSYTIKADVVDLAGNILKRTTHALKIDTTNTQTITARFVNKDTVSDSATSNTDWTVYTDGSSKGRTIFTSVGTGESLTKVEILVDGNWVEGTLGDAIASFQIPDVITADVTYQFRTTDVAGNLSATSSKTLTVQALPISTTTAITVVADGTTQVLPTSSGGVAFVGGNSEQTFEISADTIVNYLGNATPTEQWVHAGGGIDTLKVTGVGTVLNLNDLSSEYTTVKLQSFEIVDMKTDAGAQTLIGTSTAFASLGSASWLVNAQTDYYQVIVRGNTGDTLVLSPGDAYDSTGWDLAVAEQGSGLSGDTASYKVWTNDSLKVQLLVDVAVATSNTFVSFSSISDDNGSSSTDLITSDTMISLHGVVKGLSAGDTVKVTLFKSNLNVFTNIQAVATVDANGDGIWTLDNQSNTLSVGDYTVKTVVVNTSGAAVSGAEDRIVSIVVPNVAPVNTGLTSLSTDEDTALVVTGLSVSDDANMGDNYTTTLAVTHGTLMVSGGDATITGSGTDTVTLTGAKAAINATLAATVSYVPNANYNGTAQLTMTTGDASLGDAKSVSDTVTITVNSVNDSPVITPNTAARSYTENGTAVFANDTLTLSDIDSTDITSATVKITAGLTAGDVLAFTNTAKITSSYTASTGLFTLTGAATKAEYQAALQAVTYSSLSESPTAISTSRTLTWQIDDGKSANNTSNLGTSSINVTAINDAPVNTVPQGKTVNEDTQLAITGISVNDVDSDLGSTKISVSYGMLNIELNGASITAGANDSATLTLIGTQAQINAALATVKYTPSQNYNGTDSLIVLSKDVAGTPLSDSDSIDITVNAINDAPVNTVPSSQDVVKNVSKVISGISVSDVDAGSSSVTVTLEVSHGTVVVGTGTGVTLTGSATGVVTLTGSVSSINGLLATANAVTYIPSTDYVGSDILFVTTHDGGNTGSGGAATYSDQVGISVIDNIAPTLSGTSPLDNAITVSDLSANITLTFSEAVKKGNGTIELYKADGTLVQSFDVATSTEITGWNGSTLTINPTSSLLNNQGYYVKVADTAVTDLSSNAYSGITAENQFNFVTTSANGTTVVSPILTIAKMAVSEAIESASPLLSTSATGNNLITNFGTAQLQGDDTFVIESLGSAFTGGLRLFGQVYSSVFVGSNGLVTFDKEYTNYTSVSLTPWAQPFPIIAAFLTDVDPTEKTKGISTGGTSTGTGNVYFRLDTVNSGFMVTYDDISPNALAASGVDGTTQGNAFQIKVVQKVVADTTYQVIELVYENISWGQGNNNNAATAGWSAGNGFEGQPSATTSWSGNATTALSAETSSNIARNGVWRWIIDANTGKIVSNSAEAPLSRFSTTVATVATLTGTDSSGEVASTNLSYSLVTNGNGRFVLDTTNNKVTVKTVAGAVFDSSEASVDVLVQVKDTTTGLTTQQTLTLKLADKLGTTGADILGLRNATEVATLVSATVLTIDGAAGFDTLKLHGSGLGLNLTTINNAVIQGIEKIDLSATDAQTLTLKSADVVAISKNNVNAIHTGTASLDGLTWTNVTGTALAASSTYAQLVVDGTSADSVTIKTDTGTWANAGTVSNGISNYIVWEKKIAKTQILVQSAVNVVANVAPIILDLNGDGMLSYSQVQMDVLSNGQLQQTAWVDAKDGVLVWDKLADGHVHDNSQYVFSQYSAIENATDLQGLAESFDTNHDGVFDTTDAKFAEFGVWQDHNQNGLTDMGEVQTLNSKGIASIQLNSDGVVRTPAVNVVEAGHTTALLNDGSVVVVSDAEFSVQMLAYHIDAVAPDYTKLTLTGAAIDLNLSTFANKHGAIAEVDLSGAGANSIRLNLADLLQDTPHASLKITGDADDSAHVDLSDWSQSGRIVTEGGHTYAVYNDVAMHSAQLLIDQAMLNAHHVS